MEELFTSQLTDKFSLGGNGPDDKLLSRRQDIHLRLHYRTDL